MAVAGPTDEAIAAMVASIVRELQDTNLCVQLQKAAQNEVTKTNTHVTDMKKGIIQGLVKSGWETKLRNAVYKSMITGHTPTSPVTSAENVKEPISYIRKAQVNWEKRILKSLNSMCTELGIPLAKKRTAKEQRELLNKWTELGTEEPDLSQFRPVYAPKDFLDVISSLKSPNLSEGTTADATSFCSLWGVIQIPLKVKDIYQLRLQFSDMSINERQGGVDDCPDVPAELFDNDRNKLTKKVLAADHSPITREFAKRGCPQTHRAELWSQILGVELDDIDVMYYEQLKHHVIRHDMLVDNLIYKDVKLTATNDDQYFVFEDYLYMILLPFSRDTEVLKHFEKSSASPAKSYIRGKMGIEEFAVTYPPSGVIPFHGFAMYAAPLMYIYNDPVMLYFMFREIYTRYFFRLHTLSSDPQGIVALCFLFENLLQTHEPQLVYHLKSYNIQPLRVAFKWLIRAFSGYLDSEQVLLLWDRIFAYSSLEILAVLAMAIFSFRKTNLMQVQTFNAAEAVLADITTIQVIPLIQLTLFSQ